MSRRQPDAVRIGWRREPEELVLARLLIQIGRLGHPGDRRWLLESIADTYGAAVPARRASLLRSYLLEAQRFEAEALRGTIAAGLAALVPIRWTAR